MLVFLIVFIGRNIIVISRDYYKKFMKQIEMICTECVYLFKTSVKESKEPVYQGVCPKCSGSAFPWELVKVWAKECSKMNPSLSPQCPMFPFRDKTKETGKT